MQAGEALLTELREHDRSCAALRVRRQALTGLAPVLGPLLAPDGAEASVLERSLDDAATQVLLGWGPAGAVVCIARANGSGGDLLEVTHSAYAPAVQAIGQRLDAPVAVPDVPASPLLRPVLAGVLAGLDAAAQASARHAADRLHDGPLQELTAAQLLLETAGVGTERVDAALVDRAVETLRAAILSSRRLMTALLGDEGP